jgi:hypothetical protein
MKFIFLRNRVNSKITIYYNLNISNNIIYPTNYPRLTNHLRSESFFVYNDWMIPVIVFKFNTSIIINSDLPTLDLYYSAER